MKTYFDRTPAEQDIIRKAYEFEIKAIEETGYSQYVGLEYRPSKASAETVADVIDLAR